MGEVLVTFRVMPASPETRLEDIKKRLEKFKPQRIETEEIAFGLKALRMSVVVPDSEGGSDGVERAIRALDGIGEVEVVELTRTFF